MDIKPEIINLIEDDNWIIKEVKPLVTPLITQPSDSILVNSNLTSQVPTSSHQSTPRVNPSVRPRYCQVLLQPCNIPATPTSTTTETTANKLGRELFKSIANDETVDVNVLTVEYKGIKYGVSGIVMPILMSRLAPIENIKVEEESEEGGEVISEDEGVGEVSSSQCSPPFPRSLSSVTSTCSSDKPKKSSEIPIRTQLIDLMMKMVDMYKPKSLADWKKMREDFNKVFKRNCSSKTLGNVANDCRRMIREKKGIQPWDLEIMNQIKNDNQNHVEKEKQKRRKVQELIQKSSKKSKPFKITKNLSCKNLPETEAEKIRKIQEQKLKKADEEKLRKTEEEKLLKEKTEKERVEKMVLEILNREKAEKEKVDAEARKAEAAKRRLEFVKKKREQLLAKSLEPPKFNFLLKRPEK